MKASELLHEATHLVMMNRMVQYLSDTPFAALSDATRRGVLDQLGRAAGEALTTVTFYEKDGKTLLVIHDLYPSKDALDAAIASGATG